MFCRYCGKETEPGKFCLYCGKQLIADETPSEGAQVEPQVFVYDAEPQTAEPYVPEISEEQKADQEKVKRQAGLWLGFGIAACVTGFIPYVGVVGLILGIVALCLSLKARNRLYDAKLSVPGKSIAAIIVSSFGSCLALVGVCTVTIGVMLTRLYPDGVSTLLMTIFGY